jgi:medium-chain acyl-[acyl-carrier-protein] hydrolase
MEPFEVSWCTRLERGGPGRLRLICFPHAGAASYVYRQWIAHLPPHVELWGVHPPGRGERIRERPFHRIEPLVTALMDHLPLDELHPFAFFGHSVGALVAFELTRRLHRERVIVPRHLFASGYRAPDLPMRRPPLHDAPRERFVRALERYGGIPRDVLDNAEMMELLLPAIRADFELAETYACDCREPLPCSITCYGGTEDDEAREEDLRGWQHYTDASFALQIFEGNHFFPFQSKRYLTRFSSALESVCAASESVRSK